jgi:agmatinase
MDRLDELAALLRPAGGGLYLVSTGRAAQEQLQRTLYRATSDVEVKARFVENLGKLASAKAFILGVPSDVGAGFVRGANLGPQVIRQALVRNNTDWPARAEAAGIIDIGDVFCVPQLLHDEMLNDAQKAATRRAIYPELDPALAAKLPVSPLSIAERVIELVLAINPRIAPFVIGGDHSTAWPAVAAIERSRTDRWSIVQPDAHTDLLEHRLGVKYCFATWSYHANELLHRDGRMVQVGIRASGKDQKHWETTLGVRQFWAAECRAAPSRTLDAIIDHLKSVKADSVYFSNDIDGTDSEYADATGTPEPWGLEPEWLVKLIRRLGAEVGLLGGDIVEVAPPLRQIPRGARKTTDLAARYLRETIQAALGVGL